MAFKICFNEGNSCEVIRWLRLVVVLVDGTRKFYTGTENHKMCFAGLNRQELRDERAQQIQNNPYDTLYTKLSFQGVIALTETFLDGTRAITENPEVIELSRKEIAEAPSGKVIEVLNAQLFWCDLPIQMLRNMSDHTQEVHRKGWIGTIRKIISFIHNLFLKWGGILTFTDFTLPKIKWPKDNCSYALKVADEYEKIRKVFAKKIPTLELVSRLENELKEIIGPDISPKAYKTWVAANHSDKHENSEEANERFKQADDLYKTLSTLREMLELSPPKPLQSALLKTDEVD